jgi:hypothetical protein
MGQPTEPASRDVQNTPTAHRNRQLIPDIPSGGGVFAWAIISAAIYLAMFAGYMLL